MAVLALGIVMTVVSGTVMNCGEAVVQAVVRKTGARFGTVKVGFDLACAAWRACARSCSWAIWPACARAPSSAPPSPASS
ncbi:MAG: hypothetical protein ACLSDQ_04470 [Adlercreutzia equolifaciens]